MLKIGSLLDGKYKILNKIGQGGMSVVYLAMNEKANKQWAVKELRREKTQNYEMMKQSLIIETNLLKELKHPCLPSIADVIENEDTIIIVMDYVEGRPLSEILKERAVIEQDEAVGYAIQLCDVLNYLHSQKPPIIYRDLKPANIMLRPDGRIALIDFGTARKYNYDAVSDTSCLGTLGYAAPEQFAGIYKRQTDERTDIYNLGATIYHLLTGINPSESPYELHPIRKWNEKLSGGLEKIILRATQKEPEKRFNNCKEFSYALKHFRDLDDSYILRQKKKILLFAITVFLSISGFVTAVISKSMEKRAVLEVYNNYLYTAAIQNASKVNKDEIDLEILKMYQAAIDIAPQNSEAYIRMLDYYIEKGQTVNGLRALSAMIASERGELKKNSDVMMKMGQLYFLGDTKGFSADYKTAASYFSQVDTKKYPMAKYYYSLSRSLSEIGMDWEGIVKDMNNVDEYIGTEADEVEKVEIYISLSKVYRANAYSIQKTGEKPFDRAVELLIKVEEILESPYIDKEVRENHIPEVYLGLADAYYKRASIETEGNSQKDLRQAILYYEQYLIFANSSQNILFRNRIGDIYRTLGEYNRAASEYEEIINDYPDDVSAYISMSTMLLMDVKDVDGAVKYYDKAKNLRDAKTNSNFISLRNKLENLGVV